MSLAVLYRVLFLIFLHVMLFMGCSLMLFRGEGVTLMNQLPSGWSLQLLPVFSSADDATVSIPSAHAFV